MSADDLDASPAHVLSMNAHPPLFVQAPLPGHAHYPGREMVEAKWNFLESSVSVRLTSRLCLLPVTQHHEPMPVTLHADDSSLFYVDERVAADQGGDSGGAFDFLSPQLLCFDDTVYQMTLRGLRGNCRQRAGATPPHTCFSIIRLPPQFPLKFHSSAAPLQLRSRVLYKAVVELSLSIERAVGEGQGEGGALQVDLVSPVFFTAFRQRINFAYLVQSEVAFETAHLETAHSVALVSQWRDNATRSNSFHLPNRCLQPTTTALPRAYCYS